MTLGRTRSWMPIAVAVVMLASSFGLFGSASPHAAVSTPTADGTNAGGGPVGSTILSNGVIQYSLAGHPQRIAAVSSTHQAFVSESGELQVLNTTSDSVALNITTGGSPAAHSADYPIVYDPMSGLVYEGLYRNSSIEYVYAGNLTHGSIPIPGGSYAMELLYDPAAESVLVFGPAGHGFWTLAGLRAMNRTEQFGASANQSLGDLYGVYSAGSGSVYVGAYNATSTGHSVWELNATTLVQYGRQNVGITWPWNDMVSGGGHTIGVSDYGEFSTVNLTSGAVANYTWTTGSIGSQYYSLAYSPLSNVWAVVSKEDRVRLISAATGTMTQASTTGPVPQVAYSGLGPNEFVATSWNPSANASLYIVTTTGAVSTITTGIDTFAVAVTMTSSSGANATAWVGGSQYGSYPDADSVESYAIPAASATWHITGAPPFYHWSIYITGIGTTSVPVGTLQLSETLTPGVIYNWSVTAQDFRFTPSNGSLNLPNGGFQIISLASEADGPYGFSQVGGNHTYAQLVWTNPPGTVNVTLHAAPIYTDPTRCGPYSATSLGNVTSTTQPDAACYYVQSWNASGEMASSVVLSPIQLTQNNSIFRLPAWNDLSEYAFNNACETTPLACPMGTMVQQPVLSWTSGGVYYVNATDRLVYYSFATRSITQSWPWIPLTQDVMTYNGIENTEWITPNGEWVYTFGYNSQNVIAFYGVNTSSGATVMHNFTGAKGGGQEQVNIIGVDGEYNTVVLLTQFSFFSLTNGSSWNLSNAASVLGPRASGGLEANNVYWVPEINSMVEVYAGGANPSGWTQLRWTGTTLENVSAGTISVSANGVQGLYFNLTSHRLYSDAQPYSNYQYTWYWSIGGENTTLGPIHVVSNGTYAHGALQITAPVHRMMESASGVAVGGLDGGQAAWATGFSPNGSLIPETPYNISGGWQWSPQALEGLGYDGAYMLSPVISDCYQQECALAGNNQTWYRSSGWIELVGNESFPTNAPLALGPPASPNVTVRLTATSANISWTEPATSEALNYTLWWGTKTSGLTQSVSLLPSNSSFELTGLSNASDYEFEVVAHNLDWYGAASFGIPPPRYNLTFSESGLPAGTSWSVDVNGTTYASTTSSVTVSETNGIYSWTVSEAAGLTPSPKGGQVNLSKPTNVSITFAPPVLPGHTGTVSAVGVGSTYALIEWGASTGATNYSLSYGATCAAVGAAQSLGDVLDYNLTGLAAENTYCIRLLSWNGTVSASITNDTVIFTGSPQITTITATTLDVQVAWQDPSGGPIALLDAVYLYAADGALIGSTGTGTAATTITLAGLEYSTTYSVRVKAVYTGGGSSMLSAPVSFQTPGCTQGCAASAQPGLLGWLSVPINAAILVGFGASAVLGAAAATLLRGPKKRRR